MRHLSDLDLVAAASGLRPPRDPLVRHLAACDVCRARADGLTVLMPSATPVIAPPPWPGVAASVGPSRHRPIVRRAAWAALALLAILGAWGPKLAGGPAPWGPQALSVLALGRAVTLRAAQAPSGAVHLRWDPVSGWALVTANALPALPAGTVYELWWIRGTQHVRAAVFRPGPGGRLAVWVRSRQNFRGVTAAGITREPAPGLSAPTAPPQYYGSLGGPTAKS